jgi:hypothetical protein
MEPFQQRAAVKLQRLLRSPSLSRLHEERHVQTEELRAEAYFFVPPAQDGLLPQRATKMMEGLPEGGPGTVLIKIGPEKTYQLVAAVKSSWLCDGKIGEKRNALRLREDREDLFSLRASEIQGAEQAKLEHGDSSSSQE